MQLKDLTGKRFGHVIVLGLAGHLPVRWRVRCECGSERILRASLAKKGFSCGCVSAAATRKRSTTHGKSKTKEYRAWMAMKVRCYDVNSPPYPNYGGRGIRVCDRWLGSFEAFLADVGEAPSPDLSIERRDNDRGYEPGNVYWATDSEQNANKRMTDKRLAANRRAARSKGIRKYGVCISEEARKAGISKGTVMTRLRHGWTLSQALATPPVKVGSRPVRLG